MYFITKEPRIFNVDPPNDVLIHMTPADGYEETIIWDVVIEVNGRSHFLYTGNKHNCTEFINGLAFWLGAVLPLVTDIDLKDLQGMKNE